MSIFTFVHCTRRPDLSSLDLARRRFEDDDEAESGVEGRVIVKNKMWVRGELKENRSSAPSILPAMAARCTPTPRQVPILSSGVLSLIPANLKSCKQEVEKARMQKTEGRCQSTNNMTLLSDEN
jgi:hypothetical protein